MFGRCYFSEGCCPYDGWLSANSAKVFDTVQELKRAGKRLSLEDLTRRLEGSVPAPLLRSLVLIEFQDGVLPFAGFQYPHFPTRRPSGA